MNGDSLDTQDQLLEIQDFSGGLNIKSADSLIKDNQATERLNCHSDETGAIVKRNGRQYLNSTEITASKGIYGLYKFYKSDGNSYLMAACDTKIHQWDGTDWDIELKTGLTASKRFKFATYDISDIVIIVNGADAPMKYAGGGAGTVSALGGSPPADLVDVIICGNRCFGYEPDSSYLYCSALGNMESWDTTNWKWSVGSTTGDFLTGMGILSGMLVLFKQNSVRNFMTDGDRTGWQMGDPLTTKGCASRYTVVNAMLKGIPVLIYLSMDGVYAFDGRGSISLTENDLDPIFTDGSYTYRLSKAYADTSVAEIHNNKYYLSYPYGSASLPNRTLVFDLITGGWSVYDYGVLSFCEFRGKGSSRELYSGLTALGNVVREDYGDYDLVDTSSGNIEMKYKSKNFAPAGTQMMNQFWKIFVDSKVADDCFLRVDVDADRGNMTKNITLTLGATGFTLGTSILDIDSLGGTGYNQNIGNLQQYVRGKYLALQLYKSDREPITVTKLGILYTPEYQVIE